MAISPAGATVTCSIETLFSCPAGSDHGKGRPPSQRSIAGLLPLDPAGTIQFRGISNYRKMHKIKININGKDYEHDVEPRLLLVHYVREKCRLTGTHVGCDTGSCGACTVVFNGRPVKSCLILAVQANKARITTIEGVSGDGLHPVQEAFMEKFAIQCGYCTPGMILSAMSLLQVKPLPSEEETREAIEGNLCMCTGYQQIVEAILHAAGRMKE